MNMSEISNLVAQISHPSGHVIMTATNPNCSYKRGQNLTAAQKQTQMNRGRTICKSLGMKAAINYLKKHGYSAEMCVEILLKKTYNILAGV